LSLLSAEPDRQAEAYVRASRLLAIIGIPLCLMQAMLAEPFIILIYGAKWSPSIVLFQILSVATLFVLLMGPGNSMLQAQGRFRLLAVWSAILAIGFVGSVQVGVRLGGSVGVATAVSLFFAVTCPIQIWICVGMRLKLVGLLSLIGLPLAGSMLGALMPIAARLLAPSWTGPAAGQLLQWTYAVASGVWMTIIYILFVRMTAPGDYLDLRDRLKPYLVVSFGVIASPFRGSSV
jgi:O-antigen/teichoic acid export membrane protein